MTVRRQPPGIERSAESLRSSLARHLPDRPASETQLLAMRRAAWLKEGIVVVRPEDLNDDWHRQIIINVATKLYGARRSALGGDASTAKAQGRSKRDGEA